MAERAASPPAIVPLPFHGMLTNRPYMGMSSQVPPQHKLPAFYLIDAISKNVFEPYAKRFASIVTPLFLSTYEQSDDQTRNKMEEMLLTWRDGAPHRREVFGPVTQLAIERGVWGGGKVATVSFPAIRALAPVKRGRIKISRGQVLSELQYAIGRRERELQTNPYDQEARTKLEVMQQVSFSFKRHSRRR